MPAAPALRAPALNAVERAAFERDGFILKRGLLPAEWVARISAETDALHDRMAQAAPPDVHVTWDKFKEGRPRRIKQLMHSETVSPGLNRLVRCDLVLDIVEQILGPDITLFHSKLLMKAALDGTAVPWHQDYAYWKKEGNRPLYLNCMLAIDPATRENGCIQFVPGTHRQGLVEHVREQNEAGFGVRLPGAYFAPRPDAVHVEMAAGDCVFFNALVIHGSTGNASPRDRRANTAAYVVTGNDVKHTREVLRGRPA